MAYQAVERDVRKIIRRTRDTRGLGRAIADLLLEEAERIMQDSKGSEGSEKKGYLEEAITSLETAYRKHPDPQIAAKLAEAYKLLGDVKRAHEMPGYEDDYARSESYAEQSRGTFS